MLIKQFPEGINVTQMKDPGTTGNFEITIGGTLLHSKKTRSEGFFEKASAAQQQSVFKAIEEALANETDKPPSTGDITSGKTKAGGGCSIQ